MSRKSVSFVLSDSRYRYSSRWKVICTKKSPDVMVMVHELGGVTKLTLHSPRPSQGLMDWVMHVRRASDPFNSSSASKTLMRSVAYEPIAGLFCACAICIPHSQRQPLWTEKSKKSPLLSLPPPSLNYQATITIWVSAARLLAADQWPEKNKGTSLLWKEEYLADYRSTWCDWTNQRFQSVYQRRLSARI